MDILDTPTAFARVEKRLGITALSSTNPTSICISHPILPVHLVRGIIWVVHYIWGEAIGRKRRLLHVCGYTEVGSKMGECSVWFDRQSLAFTTGKEPFEEVMNQVFQLPEAAYLRLEPRVYARSQSCFNTDFMAQGAYQMGRSEHMVVSTAVVLCLKSKLRDRYRLIPGSMTKSRDKIERLLFCEMLPIYN